MYQTSEIKNTILIREQRNLKQFTEIIEYFYQFYYE